MYWGKDIVQRDNTWVDPDTVEGHKNFDFQVEDDLSDVKNPILNILYIIIIILVIIGVGLLIWKRRKDTHP
jgi:LPXTG-motif cell wall-anchored protein